MANITETNKSDQKAKEILDKIQLTDCNELVPQPSVEEGFNGDYTCGNGYNIAKTLEDASEKGWTWENPGYVLQRKHPMCVNGCADCKYHKCTVSVAGHLVSGNLKWSGNVGNGYQMRLFIGVNGNATGYKKLNIDLNTINTRAKMDKWTHDHAQVGDICVMTEGSHKCPEVDEKPQKHVGHAALWNGRNWVSDFVQCHALVYGGYKEYNGVQIFRYADCSKTAHITKGKTPAVNLDSDLKIIYKRDKKTRYYTYGTLWVNGTKFCQACEYIDTNLDNFKEGVYNIEIKKVSVEAYNSYYNNIHADVSKKNTVKIATNVTFKGIKGNKQKEGVIHFGKSTNDISKGNNFDIIIAPLYAEGKENNGNYEFCGSDSGVDGQYDCLIELQERFYEIYKYYSGTNKKMTFEVKNTSNYGK